MESQLEGAVASTGYLRPDLESTVVQILPKEWFVAIVVQFAKIYSIWVNGMKKTEVVIYTRPGCHLCDEAKDAINASGCDGEFLLEEINIENDESLLERYGNDIPVVLIDRTEAFRHRVDPIEFKRRLRLLTR
jgi:glutaredoxin